MRPQGLTDWESRRERRRGSSGERAGVGGCYVAMGYRRLEGGFPESPRAAFSLAMGVVCEVQRGIVHTNIQYPMPMLGGGQSNRCFGLK